MERKIEDAKMDWLCKCYKRIGGVDDGHYVRGGSKKKEVLFKVPRCCAWHERSARKGSREDVQDYKTRQRH